MAFDTMTGTTQYYNFARRLSFPSLRTVVFALVLISPAASALAFLLASGDPNSLLDGLLFGFVTLTIPSVISELIVSLFVLEDDPLFKVRRCFALSLSLNAFWVLFLLVAAILTPVADYFPEPAFQLGFVLVLPLRFIIILTLSCHTVYRRMLAALLQPCLCMLAPTILYGFRINQTALAVLAAVVLAPLLAFPLIWSVERRGTSKFNLSSISFFRAFLVNVLEMENRPIEEHLEAVSTPQELTTGVITFQRRNHETTKATLVVSNFHPGPFLNVGSSVLPFLIKEAVERKNGGIAMVPHGVSGHELNVVSQEENQRVIEHILQLRGGAVDEVATSMTRASVGAASATCQCFGNSALVTLTLAPRDMEDIPTEVPTMILQSPWKSDPIIIVDSHNSITNVRPVSREEAQDLVASAEAAIKAAEDAPRISFKVGASADRLEMFRPEDGIGPGGLSVLVVETSGQRVAYITIDGNNLKTGLRERVLSTLKNRGIDDGEVMTTDSHVVSGLIPTRLGYHPVGDGIDESVLIQHLESAVDDALRNLEESKVQWASGAITVKTLGRAMFESITQEIHDSTRFVAGWMSLVLVLPVIVGLFVLR